MLQNLRTRARSEEGFTLIELLVVILIIGILAAIALPTFLGQRAKAQDSSAKSDARNAISEMESCYTDTQDYSLCDSTAASELGAGTGLNIGTADGEVQLTGTTSGFTIVGHSKSGNDFSAVRTAGGPVQRTCTTANTGGCGTSGW